MDNHGLEQERYIKKKGILTDLLNDIKLKRDLHIIEFIKCRQINDALNISAGVLNAFTVGSIISGFVYPPLFIASVCTSSLSFIILRIHEVSNIDDKRIKNNLTKNLLDDLARDLESKILKNNMDGDEMEKIYEEFNNRLNIIMATSIL